MNTIPDILNHLTAPSPRITEPDRRRQATLLSGFLLGIMIVAIIVEVITVLTIEDRNYQGYKNTILVLFLLSIIYVISRTERVQLAAFLTVSVCSVGAWVSGLFDLLFIPLWLGSLYVSMRVLLGLVAVDMVVMLVLPFFVPDLTFNYLLMGPFSFFLFTSFVLIVTTHYRNRMEQDRQRQLAEKEEVSRREAARAASLLRVAEHLNAQLELGPLLQSICEEVTQALEVPVALVTLYDERQLLLIPTAAAGMSADEVSCIPPVPKLVYNETTERLGSLFVIPDLESHATTTNIEPFRQRDLRSLAAASMKQGQTLVGTLTALSAGKSRTFSEEELLLLQGIADQAVLAIVNTNLFNDARRRMDRIQALRAIDQAIVSEHNLPHTLQVLLEQITTQLAVDAAVILLMDEEKQQLEYADSRGFQTTTLRHTRLRLGEGMAGRAAAQARILQVRDLQRDPQNRMYAPLMEKEGFVSYFAAPLLSQGKVNGVLEVFHRSALDPDEEWLGFLETLAGQAAIAIQDTTLVENLQRSNTELVEAYQSTIEGWSRALDLRDHETEGHTQRVTELTLKLARAFGFSESELVHIQHGALLHDIGKMGVPDRILHKPGPLNDEEWEIMRKHPGFAHEMLLPISYLRPALDIPYCHHEKWDGSGYPRGLKGQQIPLVARIFAVVDVWDALTSDRPYRAAWSPEKTIAHIQQGAGSHFDPYVVDVFQDLIKVKS